jgi:allophanate hydrolase
MATITSDVGASATPTERVQQAFRRIAEVDRPEVWIQLQDEARAMADARLVELQLAAGASVPLAGLTLAVKDNIDVAGLNTTAACPAFAYLPEHDAPAVARLRAAGAVVIGKTNMDQFATGLVGSRSPYGAVRDARRPEYVSGGSSSGSAVAVALGIVDLALGTDTAGSGRVPAAFQGLVGLKPTIGLVPTRGVVPASRSLDCVSVFAESVAHADRALWIMAGPDSSGETVAARGRAWPPTAPLGAPPKPRVAVPRSEKLAAFLDAESLGAFAMATARLGVQTVEVDITPLLDVAELLYGSAFVAERHAAFGRFAAEHPEALDPDVLAIVKGADMASAADLVRVQEQLDRFRVASASVFAGVDALMMPTAPFQPTLAEVAADSIGVSRALGVFTNFVNLLDLSAIAVPTGTANGLNFGVTLLAPAFGDRVVADIATRLTAEPPLVEGPSGIELLVVGAHRSGQPLNRQLTDRGARYGGIAQTASSYRLYALATDPPKPGLVRVDADGAAIEGEVWILPGAAVGPFLAGLPAPMALGSVELQDGRRVIGFTCETIALHNAPDITPHGSWPAYLESKR